MKTLLSHMEQDGNRVAFYLNGAELYIVWSGAKPVSAGKYQHGTMALRFPGSELELTEQQAAAIFDELHPQTSIGQVQGLLAAGHSVSVPHDQQARAVPKYKDEWRDAITECINIARHGRDHDAAAHWKQMLVEFDVWFDALAAQPVTPAAPVVRAEVVDERAQFEAAMPVAYPRCRNMPDGSYNSPQLYERWIGWQARAALAASPRVDRNETPSPSAPQGQEAAPIGWADRRVDNGEYGSWLHKSKEAAVRHGAGNGPAAPKYEPVPVYAAPAAGEASPAPAQGAMVGEQSESLLAKFGVPKQLDEPDDALNTILWLYRRLPRAYGRPPFVEASIKMLAKITGQDVSECLTERATMSQHAQNSAKEAGSAGGDK